jgi:hypothetical protein
MQGQLPWRDDGVYVLVRTNGEFGDVLWQDPTVMDSRFRERMRREEHVGTAPNYTARFALLPYHGWREFRRCRRVHRGFG